MALGHGIACSEPAGLVVVVGLARAILARTGQTVTGVEVLFLRLAGRVKPWPLTVAGNADGVSAVRCESIRGRMALIYRLSIPDQGLGAYALRAPTVTRLSQKATSYFCHWKRTWISCVVATISLR